MTCPRCGSLVEDGTSSFCPYCGAFLGHKPTVAIALGQARCARHPEVEAIEVCGRCGAFACARCATRNREGQVICAACAERIHPHSWIVPWEERQKHGLLKAYWLTTKAIMFKPGESFEGMAPSDSWWSPLSYAILSSLAAFSGVALFYLFIFGAGFVGALFGSTEEGVKLGGMMAGLGVGTVAIALVGAVAMAVVGTFVLGGVEHLMLMIVGARPGDFHTTVRAYCYAHAPMIFGLVPMCGAYVYPFWQLVCRIFGYKGLHKTTGGKATAAVLIPMGLCCGAGIAIYALAFAAMLSRAGVP
ncbi:MAG: YIP1 family protein [Myxococcales bacterium]|jgi:hypothetical protein